VDERETRLVTERVKAPDLGNVDLVLSRQPPRYFNRARGDVKMERGACSAKVGPLGHRFEMIDGFGRFHLNRANQLVAPVRRRKYQIRKELNLPDAYRSGL
jgi:hypothetical protein